MKTVLFASLVILPIVGSNNTHYELLNSDHLSSELIKVQDNSFFSVNESIQKIGLNYFGFQYFFSNPNMTIVYVNDEPFIRVTLPNCLNSNQLNCPRLPVRPLRFLIPYGHLITSVQVIPTVGVPIGTGYSIERGSAAPHIGFTKNHTAINSFEERYRSSEIFSIEGMYTYRGFTLCYLNLYPVSYDESTGTLEYYPEVWVNITTSPGGPVSDLPRFDGDDALLGELVENPEILATYPCSTDRALVDYVIITNEELADALDNREYAKHFDGAAMMDGAQGVITDEDDNVYIVGYGEDLVGETGRDWWLKKFDRFGTEDTGAWNKSFDGSSGSDRAYDVAVDADRRVCVVGYGYGLNGSTSYDWWIMQFNGSSGERLWEKRYDGRGGSDFATAVACDTSGRFFIAGYGSNLVGKDTGWDWWLKCVNHTGSEDTILWNHTFDSNHGQDRIYALTMDETDHLYAVGCGKNLQGNTGIDWWIMRFNTTTGEREWNLSFDGGSGGGDIAYDVATNKHGDVYVVGSGFNHTGSNSTDWWMLRLNGRSGEIEWNATASSPGAYADEAHGVCIDSRDNVYIAGFGTKLHGSTEADWWIKKYDPNGVEDTKYWNKTYDGNTLFDVAEAITVDPYDTIYVVGSGEQLNGSTRYDWWQMKFTTYTFQDLIDYKNQQGLSTTLVTVEEIDNNPSYWVNGTWGDNNPSNPFYQHDIVSDINRFNDTQAKIRNFIRSAYVDWGTHYVLLAGDFDDDPSGERIVPVRQLYANETGLPLATETFEEDHIPSDVYYACLDGNFNADCDNRWGEGPLGNNLSNSDEADLLAEVWVGRVCVDAVDEVSNIVAKTLRYETETPLYRKKVQLVGEDLGFPGVSEYGGNYKDLIEPFIPKDYSLGKMYDREITEDPGYWTREEMIDLLNNNTPHLINHLGHGNLFWTMRLQPQHVLQLTNDDAFFIYSHACLAGSFDNRYRDRTYTRDCMAEYYTVETPHGAVAVVMNARFGLGSNNTLDSPSQAYDESFFEALFYQDIGTLGHASHYSKEDNIWRINENGMRWVYYETNVHGDPTINLLVENTSTPPEKPLKPQGNTNGDVGKEYWYQTQTTDTDGDTFYYLWDWGDDQYSSWLGPYSSGVICEAVHIWNTPGLYPVRVRARDSNGALGPWSDPLMVTQNAFELNLDGYGYYQTLDPISNMSVQIINQNTHKTWKAQTEGNYYWCNLSVGEDINVSETLRYITKDNTTWINVTDHVISQDEINQGHLSLDFIVDEYYRDLIDFPMYHAETDNAHYSAHQLTGAAVAQMTLNYMWWNTSRNKTTPMRFTNQTWLFETAQANNSNTSLPYMDTQGMYSVLKNNKPEPYERYGYHFDIKHSTEKNDILSQICQWIDYPAGRKPGHPVHIPAAVPTFGQYRRWMNIRGIHMNQSAYPPNKEITVHGFWINDPYTPGIGENSYKTAEEWNQTYYLPLTVSDDPYQGEYVAVVEPPSPEKTTMHISKSPPHFSTPPIPPPQRMSSGTQGFFRLVTHSRIIHAAVQGVHRHLLPYDPTAESIFNTTYPETPYYVLSCIDNKSSYYLVPFANAPITFSPQHSHSDIRQNHTSFVVIIDATDGHFKEASWAQKPMTYLPVSQQKAWTITTNHLEQRGYAINELQQKDNSITLVYQNGSPYYPEWKLTFPQINIICFISQDETITIQQN